MRLNPTRRSGNLEDRRAGGGFGGGFGGGRGLGLGGLVVLLVLSFVFKTDLVSLAGGGGGTVPAAGPVEPLNDPAEEGHEKVEQLMARAGAYRRLIERQLLEEELEREGA
jgi:predicted metalloprotease